MKSVSRPTLLLFAFIMLNAAWRLIFLPANQSAYTDGILQVDMFNQGVSYWPPLYALLARLFVWIPGLGLEGAGRLVSILCGVGLLWPLADLARRLFGARAAFWAMAAWTATPLALQWSLQVMTDMPFAFFWLATLAALLAALQAYRPALFAQPDAPAPLADPRKGAQLLLIASFSGALATLTRYQGILLLAPLILAAWRLGRVARTLPGRRAVSPWLTLIPWLAVPAGLAHTASAFLRHFAQIGERAAGGSQTALLNYWNLFEEFLLKSPYFVSYGIFGFFLYGLFRTQWATARLRWAGWIALYLGLAILAMQSVFQSYQARYLLPLVPLVCLFAGHGLATWERHTVGRPLRRWGPVLPTLALGLAFSTLVAVYQGSPFLELKQAARYVKGLNLPEARQVFCNEVYNAEQGLYTVKSSFWAGRKVLPLTARRPRPGDFIILFSYSTGLEPYRQLRNDLIQQLPAHEKTKRFARFALPLLTDIMQEPGTAQSPLAWCYRYQRQYFEAAVLEVDAPAIKPELGSEPIKPIPPIPTTMPADKLKTLQDIHEELNKLM